MENFNELPVIVTKRDVNVASIFLVVIIIVLSLVIYNYNLTKINTIIYDQAIKGIRHKIGFWVWLIDRDRFIFIPKKIEVVNVERGFAFKAIFRMPNDMESIESYLTGGSFNSNQIKKDLEFGIKDCVGMMQTTEGIPVADFLFRIPNRLEVDIESMRLDQWNMNKLCPMRLNHGYKWDSNLVLVQCYGNFLEDDEESYNCAQWVKSAHY